MCSLAEHQLWRCTPQTGHNNRWGSKKGETRGGGYEIEAFPWLALLSKVGGQRGAQKGGEWDTQAEACHRNRSGGQAHARTSSTYIGHRAWHMRPHLHLHPAGMCARTCMYLKRRHARCHLAPPGQLLEHQRKLLHTTHEYIPGAGAAASDIL